MCYHKITYYIMSAVTAFALASGLTSCGNEDEVVDTAAADGQYQIEFYIQTTDNSSTRTTIDWENLPEEKGNEAENILDPNSLKIFFFKHNFPEEYGWKSDGSAGGRWNTVNGTKMPEMFTLKELNLEKVIVTSTEDGAYVKGTLTGTWLTDTWPKKDFKMYVEVNYYGTSDAESTSAKDLDAFSNYCLNNLMGKDKFTFSEGYTPSSSKPIPMAGMITCTDVALTQGKVYNLGTIPLIRALAKIEVIPGDANTNLSNVKLQRCYDTGMVNPYYATPNVKEGILDALEVPTDNNLNIAGEGATNSGTPGVLGISNDGLGNTALSFLEHKDENGKVDKYIIYLPEYRITGNRLNNSGKAADPDNKITLSINGYPYSLYFREYADVTKTDDDNNEYTVSEPTGSYFNIIRNHIYRYTVSLAKEPGGDLSLRYMVIPWTNYTAPDITFE